MTEDWPWWLLLGAWVGLMVLILGGVVAMLLWVTT
jgi:hypothetical protein